MMLVFGIDLHSTMVWKTVIILHFSISSQPLEFSSCCQVFKYIISLAGTINLPDPDMLPDDTSGKTFPYMFVGDEAFPLRPYLMRPFPGRTLDSNAKKIFNYRLSRSRRVIENCFGMYIDKLGSFIS